MATTPETKSFEMVSMTSPTSSSTTSDIGSLRRSPSTDEEFFHGPTQDVEVGGAYHVQLLNELTCPKTTWRGAQSVDHLFKFTPKDMKRASSLPVVSCNVPTTLKLQHIIVDRAVRSAEAKGANFSSTEGRQIFQQELVRAANHPGFSSVFPSGIPDSIRQNYLTEAFIRQGAKTAMGTAEFDQAFQLGLDIPTVRARFTEDTDCQERASIELATINSKINRTEGKALQHIFSQRDKIRKLEVKLLEEESKFADIRSRAMQMIGDLPEEATPETHGKQIQAIQTLQRTQREAVARIKEVRGQLDQANDWMKALNEWAEIQESTKHDVVALHQRFTEIQRPFQQEEIDSPITEATPSLPVWGTQGAGGQLALPALRTDKEMIQSLVRAIQTENLFSYGAVMNEMKQYRGHLEGSQNLFDDFVKLMEQKGQELILQELASENFSGKRLAISALQELTERIAERR